MERTPICTLIGKIINIKMANIPKAIYKLNAILIRILCDSFKKLIIK